MLDASAIGISFVKRDVNTAGQTMFLLKVGELLEDYTRAMSAIGLNTDIVKLVRTGGKPIALGACCWGRHRLRELGYAARYRHLVRKTRRRVCGGAFWFGDAFWRGHNLV